MNNPADRADISLTTFNGLVSELGPSDIPSGTSPLNWDVDFPVGAVKTRNGLQTSLSTFGTNNFNSIRSYQPTNQQDKTFALDSTGQLWIEDVVGDLGTLTPFYNGLQAGTYVKSLTQFEREWMCFSDLKNGTDIPRQYTSQGNFDRISQVGPGAPPVVATSANNYSLAASPTGITQPPQNQFITGAGSSAGHFQAVNWAASAPTGRSPGNALTIFYNQGSADPNLKIGAVVELTGMASIAGQNPNGTYMINATGFDYPSGGAGAKRYWFSVTTEQSVNQFLGSNAEAGNYQVTLATVTTTAPVPDIAVGSQLALTGVGLSAWDNSWTVTATLNSGQYQITQTSLTSTVASYSFTVITGVAPVIGEQITVTGCNNSAVFNVTNASVTGVSGGVFTITLPPTIADIAAAPESGAAITSGTKFVFDPGLAHLGQATDVGYVTSIFGNSGGGNIAVSGDIAAGVRQCVCIFKTRNAYLTAPSKPVVFSTSGGSKLLVSNIPIGPPNVIARILAFTGANGGYFFWIPQPVTVTGVGQAKTYSATILNDNFTTSVSLDFTDDILLAALSIDTAGSNLFNLTELSNCVWDVSYASRNFYGGEDNKIQNLTNSTFDGGFSPSNPTLPAGWVADATNNAGGTITVSPIFGNSYRITGDGSTFNGWICQSAYQDFYQVPIIRTEKTYSARITCREFSGSGSLRLSLTSPQFGTVLGDIDIPVSSMSSTMRRFNLPLLATPLTQVPTDLTLNLAAVGLAPGAIIEVDRIEIYPDDQPVLTTEIAASYAYDAESLDGVSGAIGLDQQNNQAVIGAFTQYNLLYFLKENSIYSTQDTPKSEPSGWTIKEVSNTVGCVGPQAFDFGEEWAVIAHRSGLYLFDSKLIRINEEIKNVWEFINWNAGQTIWVRNNLAERKIMVGVPLITPNPWLPNDAPNTPTSPSHILMCSYAENNTGQALAEKSAIHVSFSGSMVSFPTARCWTIWHISSPDAEMVSRGAGGNSLFFCNGIGSSKIYSLVSGARDDDGIGINSSYCTYGFVQTEQENQFGPLLGAHRKLYNYLDLSIVGNGRAVIQAFPNTLQARHPYIVPGGAYLFGPSTNDRDSFPNCERPLNVTANRCFIQISTSGAGNWFQVSKIVLTAVKDMFAPVTGMTRLPFTYFVVQESDSNSLIEQEATQYALLEEASP